MAYKDRMIASRSIAAAVREARIEMKKLGDSVPGKPGAKAAARGSSLPAPHRRGVPTATRLREAVRRDLPRSEKANASLRPAWTKEQELASARGTRAKTWAGNLEKAEKQVRKAIEMLSATPWPEAMYGDEAMELESIIENLATNADEVREHASNILGLDIKGHVVKVIWVEVASDIDEEYYASFTLDRSAKKHLGMLSAQGGVEIEAVAESDPDAIAKIWIDPVDGRIADEPSEWAREMESMRRPCSRSTARCSARWRGSAARRGCSSTCATTRCR